MVARKHASDKKVFTVGQANSTLPLVRAIVRDIAALAHQMRERHAWLSRARAGGSASLSTAHEEELLVVQNEFDRDQERMHEFVHELERLGVELKDCFTGLVDFPSWMDDRPVYLCWRLGEPEVAHWHELEAGFAGRQKLQVEPPRKVVSNQ
jgi:hypothetical protein